MDSTHSSAGHFSFEGDLMINEMNSHETMEQLVLCGAHLQGLDMLLLGHWLPNTVFLLTSFTSSSFACSLLYAVVTPHCPGLTTALNYTAPLWLNLHCKPVRPVPKGTCCHPLEEVCRGGTALDIGLQAIRPQNNAWFVSIKDVCQFDFVIILLYFAI